jgi:uncharacterized protein YqjF (DUF2071 family)
MYQQWRDLLFLHWTFPPAEIQRTLPDGLIVDQFDGRAWIGIVPFLMRNIRPRGQPAVPGISNFLELNLRTYVYDRSGVPGVWFYSLECNQPLAVAVARRFFHLPYQHARMQASRGLDGVIHYRSVRRGAEGPACEFENAAAEPMDAVPPGSLEYFLVERYRLYASGKGQLWSGAVHHPPYPLTRTKVSRWNERLLVLNGFVPTNRAPDHVILSPGVDVSVFPLKQIS